MSSQSSTEVIIGRWALAAEGKPVPAESSFVVGPQAQGTETSLEDDSRETVKPEDIQPRGKYYSIVKLQIQFEGQSEGDKRWAQGTGWLIKPNLLVTAGHCAYDHTYNYGRAVRVRAFVGYSGKANINGKFVQARHAIKIATPKAWIKSDVNRQNDVSLMLVDRAFENVVPVKYEPTPEFVNEVNLGVVGYPADKKLKGESAAEMYEMYKVTTCNLAKTKMLEYTISTFGGQSGSPVLIEGINTSIGAHVYGLGNKNSASVIRGKYGNYYKALGDALKPSANISTPKDQIEYVKFHGEAENSFDEEPPTDEESFWDTFNHVANIGSKIGNAAL